MPEHRHPESMGPVVTADHRREDRAADPVPAAPTGRFLPRPLAGVLRRTAHDHGGADPLGGQAVDDEVAQTLRARRGSGEPLPADIAGSAGQTLGVSLDAVRVHRGPEPDRISRSLQASAFTLGTDVYLSDSAGAPGSSSGQRVLAHELVHVAQNVTAPGSGGGGSPIVGPAHDPAEADADRRSGDVLSGLRRPASVASGDGPMARRSVDVASLRRTTAEPSTGAAVIRRGFFDNLVKSVSDWFTYPGVVPLVEGGTDKIKVENPAELEEARTIVKELQDNFGINVSSPDVVKAIKTQYTKVPQVEQAKLKSSVWALKELRSIRVAADFYAPILGSKRATSTVADKAQGVTTVGKVANALDTNTAKGKLDTSTLGEYFGGSKALGFFDAVTDSVDSSLVAEGKTAPDNKTSLDGAAVHEMGHGLVQPLELDNWISTLDYWTDRSTKSGVPDAEAPPTAYGQKNAAEDLCESISVYFVNRPLLKSQCPKREKFFADMIAGWTPEKKEEVLEGATTATGGGE